MSVLWKLQPSTAAKHLLYQHYLDAWWPKLLQTRPGRPGFSRVTYLDAFAGPGIYKDGEPGSPILAISQLLGHAARDRMQLSRERVAMLFVEKSAARHRRLRQELDRNFGRLDQLPVDVRPPYRGEAADCVLPILDQTGAWSHPILAIFDSWGNVNVPLAVLERIARNRASETIVTFGPNWFSRREGLDASRLDLVFGGRQHWQPADAIAQPSDRWRVWLESYQTALRRAGFRFTLRFQLTPATGQPLYLVYGTGHIAGLEAMKAAMWRVDGHDGLGFRDPRLPGPPSDQPGLFDDVQTGANYLELDELVRQKLSNAQLTVAELGEWLLTETSRWSRKHARVAARRLCEQDAVRLSPPGRITCDTVITIC